MTLQVRVEHTDGSTDTLTLKGERVEQQLGAKVWGKYSVPRSEVGSGTLSETDDEVYLEDTSTSPNTDVFGGLLRDIRYTKNPTRAVLVWDSFEEYARRAEPTDVETFQNVSDQTVVEDAVDRVSELSQGSINQTTTSLRFEFSYASPARMIRAVSEQAGSEVHYQPDKTVDLVAERGADKTGTTLSPANQNLGNVEVERKGGEKQITHVKALGDSRGSDQLSVDVTASSFSSGDTKKWATVTFKDVSSLSNLREKAQSWVDTLDDEYLEISGTVYDNTVDLGDTFTVDYPERNVSSATLRAVKSVRIRDPEGLRFQCTFNNKGFVEQASTAGQKRRMDVERYRRADSGYRGTNRRTFILERLASR